MARRKEENYVFDASAKTVKIPGHLNLNDLLTIINVTTNTVIYSVSEEGKGATREHSHPLLGTDPDFPWSIDGDCTFLLDYDTTSMSDTDSLLILVEDERKGLTVRPYEAAVDSIERIKVSQGQNLIDADFEYGLQESKWQNIGFNTGYPSFSEATGLPLVVTSVTTDGANPSIITVVVQAGQALAAGTPVIVTGLTDGAILAEGAYIVATSNGSTTFTYTAKAQVTGIDLETPYTSIREASLFDGSSLAIDTYQADASPGTNVTASFSQPHGLFPGSPFILIDDSAGQQIAEGPFFVNEVINSTSFKYDTGVTQDGSFVNSGLSVYAISNATFTHRPFDGGVLLNSFYPFAGLEAKRQTKRYFRYQSGKGINFSTGTLFCPVYDVSSATFNGSNISVTTDIPHGFQVGVKVALSGIDTVGYNSDITDYNYTLYEVTGITDSDTFTIGNFGVGQVNEGLDTGIPIGTATLGLEPKVVAQHWKGAATRVGMFDDSNGAYWEYDGDKLYAVLRNSTIQITGRVDLTQGSNEIVGTGTRFGEQFVAGNKVLIKGQVYEVTDVESSTVMHVNPAYRGVSINNSKISVISETRVPSDFFNTDTINGHGPSGYNLHIDRLQMMGIQWSWYGAGYVDFQVRGPLGEWITAHRMANANFQTEAYMRSGNLPARYEIVTSCRHSKVLSNPSTGTGTGVIQVRNAEKLFPQSGKLLIKSVQGGLGLVSEIVDYNGISGNDVTLTGRGSSYTRFVNGSDRTFSGITSAQDHPLNSSVQFIDSNIAPQVSHWGSAVIMDGGFTEDTGFRFTTSRFGVTISAGSSETILLFRPAPAVSNTISGEVGERELINRSRVNLSALEVINIGVPRNVGQQVIIEPRSIEVTGILNPSNVDPTALSWLPANAIPYAGGGVQTGYQPSFSQYNAPAASTLNLEGGEILFKFITSDETSFFDVSNVKELQNSIVGGNGLFPNGPEMIGFVVTNKSSEDTVVDVVLSWKEAQA